MRRLARTWRLRAVRRGCRGDMRRLARMWRLRSMRRRRDGLCCPCNLPGYSKREQYSGGKNQPATELAGVDSRWIRKACPDLLRFTYCEHNHFLLSFVPRLTGEVIAL